MCTKEQIGLRRRACCLPVLFVASLPGTAVAGEDQPRREVFSGVETTNNYTGVYAGGGYAFGEGLYGSGWRVRAVGALGRYSYDGTLFANGSYGPAEFTGDVTFLSAQAGYQVRRGPLIVKAFAGIEAVDQQISPYDPGNAVQGTALGLRIALETWADLSGRWFLSADASFGTAFQEYWELTRIGYRLGPALSAGLEGGVLATGNTTPAEAAVSCVPTSRRSRQPCRAVSPATICSTTRAAISHSAYTGHFSLRARGRGERDRL
ncbi:MAG: hypothetical protein A49_19920 [Methyloceanibacter sp.]|nr:MAG: hypothetical protein A49_19920 [Methyloceanibacter sp.]